MSASFRSGLILLTGVALLIVAAALHFILLETVLATQLSAGLGLLLTLCGVFLLRTELAGLFRRRRSETALFTLGLICVLLALGYLSTRYTWRYDMTAAGLHSLSPQTVTMLERLEKPVHVVFFHDPMMRKTVELYELMDVRSEQLSVEYHDPMLNPAQARLLGVQFAGTAIMQSEDRRLQIHGSSEAEIANGILRVSQSVTQRVCFLDGHSEADPFSMEAHDHVEGAAGHNHSHGMGAQYVLHEQHGMAKARNSLETINYRVEKVSLLQGADMLADCVVLVVAGPKIALLAAELAAIRSYLASGGNAFFMLEPFVETGLEALIREFGIILDDTIVIDAASHYWSDPSAPAVTSYNRHQITRDLPLTFFPGVRSLSPTPQRVPGTSVIPLINSSQNSYGETDPNRAEFSTDQDRPGPLTLMAVVNRKPVEADDLTADQLGTQTRTAPAPQASGVSARSRIAVIGDADFATNSFFHFLGNGNLFLNTVNYLAARENLIGIEPNTYDLPRLSVTNRQIKATFIVSIMLVPFLLALTGIAVWWRQR